MQRKSLLALLVLFLFPALACRAATRLIQPEPTPSPTSPPTLAPLPSPTPVGETQPAPPTSAPPAPSPQPEATPSEAAPGDLPLPPLGTPYTDDSYRSVPIMPGAYNATEMDFSLTYFIDQPPEAVIQFYQSVMPEKGWRSLFSGMEDASGSILMYSKDDRLATITVMESPSGTGSMVVITVP